MLLRENTWLKQIPMPEAIQKLDAEITSPEIMKASQQSMQKNPMHWKMLTNVAQYSALPQKLKPSFLRLVDLEGILYTWPSCDWISRTISTHKTMHLLPHRCECVATSTKILTTTVANEFGIHHNAHITIHIVPLILRVVFK